MVKILCRFFIGIVVLSCWCAAQDSKTAPPVPPSATQSSNVREYSGMYAFRKEGEFIQITVEDDGRVTGFISRYSDAAGGNGAFLDQFFKSATLEGNKLIFTTKIVGPTSFDFKGSVDRGEGKNPTDEAYYILRGTLTENVTDANKKVSSKSEEVAWKSFPKS